MEQHQGQALENPFHCLDRAAKEAKTAFARAYIRHGYIGGYATSLIGGKRTTSSNKLVFMSGDRSTEIELLRGGKTQQLKLPDANTVSILSVTAKDQPGRVEETPIPIVAPSVLVPTKIKRWSFLADSTRPKSITKAARDVQDIEILLRWLAKNDLYIDFEGYPEKQEQEHLSGVRKLYQMHATIRLLLEITLKVESLRSLTTGQLLNRPTVSNDRFSNA
ncbi:uncharacterized protein N7477_004965 [Penicillium maclennaniae]|uniref:uncharacterized protein n=1 Tax=Penicillium maclennaniae TaxID=1343394 RepID=UPI002540A383|nr:uncharacterized protein N7477_004965 [Penicillium maclennaniae]KAJ5675031.1 hypothetical protein N7477_004965 [Penicillium maclennaniae]